jgi:hypothetical protein
MNERKSDVVQEIPVTRQKDQAISKRIGDVILIRMAVLVYFVRRCYSGTHFSEKRNRLRWEILVCIKSGFCPPRSQALYLLNFLRSGRILSQRNCEVYPAHVLYS